MTDISIERRRELVLNAIEKCKAAELAHRAAQADAHSDADDRDAAREAFKAAEREFGWQWANVAAILEAEQ